MGNRAAPGRVHSIVNVTSDLLGDLDTDSSESGAVRKHITSRLSQFVSGLGTFNNRAGKKPATILSDSNFNKRGLGIELIKIVAEFLGLHLILDAKLRESVTERLGKALELLQRNTGSGHGGKRERSVGKEVQTHNTTVHVGRQVGVVKFNGLVEGFVGDTVGGESEVQARHMAILMSLGGHGPDNTVGSTTATGQSPVDVTIMGAVCGEELTSTVDNLPFQDLVRTKPVL